MPSIPSIVHYSFIIPLRLNEGFLLSHHQSRKFTPVLNLVRLEVITLFERCYYILLLNLCGFRLSQQIPLIVQFKVFCRQGLSSS